jgi:hypothetical protein
MLRKHLITIPALAALSALVATLPATAQMTTPIGDGPSASPPFGRPRIEINPRPVYRRCASRYVIQYRPSGPVLFPEKHCWWQRG